MITTSHPITTEYGESQRVVTLFLSVLIAIEGTATNALSLSYFFIAVGWENMRRTNDYTTILFSALNILDLSLSISALLYFTSLQAYDVAPLFLKACYIIFTLFLFTTSFLTCLLAVVRAIYLVFPFHIINWGLVKVSMLVYGIVCVALLSLRVSIPIDHMTVTLTIVYDLRFSIVAILFLVVLFSNALAMIKLFLVRSNRDVCSEENRKATVTVGIISVLYCVYNIGFIIMAGFSVFSPSSYENISIQIIDILVYIAIPLNSACNPVVYLCRNSDMRSYLKTVWKRLREKRFCMSTEESPTDKQYVKIFIVNNVN
jgi:hypothetical protein